MSVNEIVKNVDFKLVLIVLSIIALILKKYEDYKRDIEISESIAEKKGSDISQARKVRKIYTIVRIVIIVLAIGLLYFIFSSK